MSVLPYYRPRKAIGSGDWFRQALNQKNLRRKSANVVGLELGLLTLVRAVSVKPGV